MPTRGGDKLLRRLKALKASKGVSVLRVGYFPDAIYPDGISVARIAAMHEYGTPNGYIQERAFMRKALKEQLAYIRQEIERSGASAGVSIPVAQRMGQRAAAILSDSVRRHEIIDTGQLRDSPSYSIDDPPLKR